MKRKITIVEASYKPVEFEVEFPIYRRHDIDDTDTTIYTRVSSDMTSTALWVRRGRSYEFEREEQTDLTRDDHPDFTLGRGQYASSKEEFDKAVSDAIAWITNNFAQEVPPHAP